MSSGLYVPFKLPKKANLERLVERLAAKKILVVSSKRFYLSDYREQEKFLRISIARAQPERIEEGVREIIGEVSRELKCLV